MDVYFSLSVLLSGLFLHLLCIYLVARLPVGDFSICCFFGFGEVSDREEEKKEERKSGGGNEARE